MPYNAFMRESAGTRTGDDRVRLWMDAENRMLTDEQLVRHIAHYGSLDVAASHGDIRLVSSHEHPDESQPKKERTARQRRLADYISEE